jgi:hypothetical protein
LEYAVGYLRSVSYYPYRNCRSTALSRKRRPR